MLTSLHAQMPRISDDEDLGDDGSLESLANLGIRDRRQERFSPAKSGAITGFVGGGAAVGVVQTMQAGPFMGGVARLAGSWGVSPGAALGITYGVACLGGAVLGACFAAVTQRLVRWVPLLIWSLVFFVCLAMIVLAATRPYLSSAAAAMTPAMLVASVAFGFVVSLSLLIRRRA